MSAFEELGLMDPLVKALDEMEWYLPRPVQQDAIPLILGGGDVMCAAETGAGKTGAFCLPILQVTWETLHDKLNPEKVKQVLKHCQVNPDDTTEDVFRVSQSGLTCQVKQMENWGGGRANYGVKKGKWFFQAKVIDDGICRVGWSLPDANLELGEDRKGFGYAMTGKKCFNKIYGEWGKGFSRNDVVTCLCDRDAREIRVMVNGQPVKAHNSDEDAGVLFKIPQSLDDQALYPTICLKNATAELNFSERTWVKVPPEYEPMEKAKGEEQEKLFSDIALKKEMKKTQEGHHPTCIIVEPTMELGQQVAEEIKKFIKFLEDPQIKYSYVGQRRMDDVMRELKDGVDIVISTPGKLEQLLSSREGLNLSQCRFLVLDEADRLGKDNLDLCFKLYNNINKAIPKNQRLQVCMFSATLHDDAITDLYKQICPNATWVDLKGRDYVPDTVHHAVVFVDPERDDRWRDSSITTDGVHQRDHNDRGPNEREMRSNMMSERIKRLKPELLLKVIETHKMEQCLIFCRTRDDCDHLSEYMTRQGGGRGFSGKVEKGKENPFSNVALHSGFPPAQRAENLQMFKDGDVRFLICTDVAARGLDIKHLPYVISLTLPDKAEDYIHRIGRTGRADRMGLAVSIASKKWKEKVWYHTQANGCNRGQRHGKPCQDTRLVDEGGCCIWYDEPTYLQEVEKRCGEELQELERDLTFHSGERGKVEYGKSREEAKREQSDHILCIQKILNELRGMETEGQREYFEVQDSIRDLIQNGPREPRKGGVVPAALPTDMGRGRGRGRGRGAPPEPPTPTSDISSTPVESTPTSAMSSSPAAPAATSSVKTIRKKR